MLKEPRRVSCLLDSLFPYTRQTGTYLNCIRTNDSYQYNLTLTVQARTGLKQVTFVITTTCEDFTIEIEEEKGYTEQRWQYTLRHDELDSAYLMTLLIKGAVDTYFEDKGYFSLQVVKSKQYVTA